MSGKRPQEGDNLWYIWEPTTKGSCALPYPTRVVSVVRQAKDHVEAQLVCINDTSVYTVKLFDRLRVSDIPGEVTPMPDNADRPPTTRPKQWAYRIHAMRGEKRYELSERSDLYNHPESAALLAGHVQLVRCSKGKRTKPAPKRKRGRDGQKGTSKKPRTRANDEGGDDGPVAVDQQQGTAPQAENATGAAQDGEGPGDADQPAEAAAPAQDGDGPGDATEGGDDGPVAVDQQQGAAPQAENATGAAQGDDGPGDAAQPAEAAAAAQGDDGPGDAAQPVEAAAAAQGDDGPGDADQGADEQPTEDATTESSGSDEADELRIEVIAVADKSGPCPNQNEHCLILWSRVNDIPADKNSGDLFDESTLNQRSTRVFYMPRKDNQRNLILGNLMQCNTCNHGLDNDACMVVVPSKIKKNNCSLCLRHAGIHSKAYKATNMCETCRGTTDKLMRKLSAQVSCEEAPVLQAEVLARAMQALHQRLGGEMKADAARSLFERLDPKSGAVLAAAHVRMCVCGTHDDGADHELCVGRWPPEPIARQDQPRRLLIVWQPNSGEVRKRAVLLREWLWHFLTQHHQFPDDAVLHLCAKRVPNLPPKGCTTNAPKAHPDSQDWSSCVGGPALFMNCTYLRELNPKRVSVGTLFS